MKILHVTKKYPNAIGGDAICVLNLEAQQLRNGHHVTVATANCVEVVKKHNVITFGIKDTSFNWDRVTIRRIISVLMFFYQIFFIIKRIAPEIIHCHSAELAFFTSFWARHFKIPLVQTCHFITFPYPFLSRWQRYPEWFFLKFGSFDTLITVDKNSTALFEAYGIKNSVHMHMVGVNAESFSGIEKSRPPKTLDDKVRFIFVGRLAEVKGLVYLVDAVKNLTMLTTAFEVSIVGDGPQRTKVMSLVKREKLDNYFKFYESISDQNELIKRYSDADVFVLPSLMEGFPITILEAWAAGLAVIATRTGGIDYLCSDRENALLVPAKDSIALCQAMAALIKDRQLIKALGERGRGIAHTNFTWNKINKDVETLYQNVINAAHAKKNYNK